MKLLATYTEMESSKRNAEPKLAKALEHDRLTRWHLDSHSVLNMLQRLHEAWSAKCSVGVRGKFGFAPCSMASRIFSANYSGQF